MEAANNIESGRLDDRRLSGSATSDSNSNGPVDATVLSDEDLRDGIPVVDPLNTVCSVTTAPFTLIEPTKGSLVPRRSSSGAPQQQVCLAFTQGQCKLGPQCHNIHLAVDYVRATRAVKEPICCAHHNDYLSRHLLDTVRAPIKGEEMVLTLPNGATRRITPEQLMITVGLDRVLARHRAKRTGADIAIGFSSVCRLHQRGTCRWGKQCGNIHVCRCIAPGASGVQEQKVYPPMSEVCPAAPEVPAVPTQSFGHQQRFASMMPPFAMKPEAMQFAVPPQPMMQPCFAPHFPPVYYVLQPQSCMQMPAAQITYVNLQE